MFYLYIRNDLDNRFYLTLVAFWVESMELNQDAMSCSTTPINHRRLMPKPRNKTTNWK